MTINCWVCGQKTDEVFSVEIQRTATVGALGRVIKNKKPVDFAHVDSDQLFLYRVPDVTSDALEEAVEAINPYYELLPGEEPVFYFFPTPPPECRIHIVVDVPSSPSCRSISQSWLGNIRQHLQ